VLDISTDEIVLPREKAVEVIVSDSVTDSILVVVICCSEVCVVEETKSSVSAFEDSILEVVDKGLSKVVNVICSDIVLISTDVGDDMGVCMTVDTSSVEEIEKIPKVDVISMSSVNEGLLADEVTLVIEASSVT